MAEYTPSARLRGVPSGKFVVISDSAVGAITAPPTPWTALAGSAQAWLVANPPAKEAAANSSNPKTNTRRRPSRSPARPPSSSRPPNVTAYALTTHSSPLPEKPRARCTCGKAPLTVVASTPTISCAEAITTSASPSRVYSAGRSAAPIPIALSLMPAPPVGCGCNQVIQSSLPASAGARNALVLPGQRAAVAIEGPGGAVVGEQRG